jgi:hypothetical protein
MTDSASDAERRWHREIASMRSDWLERGWEFHDARGWYLAVPANSWLFGRSRREVENIEVAFSWACRRAGVSPLDASKRSEMAAGLFVDLSQNALRKPFGHGLRRVTRNSTIYSFEHDRVVTAEEGFKMYGWSPRPRLDGFSERQAIDILGDSMALPTLAVAMYSLLLGAADIMPDLFECG